MTYSYLRWRWWGLGFHIAHVWYGNQIVVRCFLGPWHFGFAWERKRA